MKKYEFLVKNTPHQVRIKDYLKSLNISNQVIKDLSKQLGLICVNGESKRTIDYVKNNDTISLIINELEQNEIIPVKHPLNIVYEDEYFLIVYKPYGIATIPSKGNYTNTLANYVCSYMLGKQNDFIFRAINRLDKSAQGYIVIALDKLIYSLLKNNIQKYYTCLCYGKLDKQVINKSIATIKDDQNHNQIKREINSSGKESFTNIIDCKYNPKLDITMAKIYIITGRTHQIRLHLSSINHPILGDKLYGINDNYNLQLYCNEIFVYHPILHKTLHFEQEIDDSVLIRN